MIGDTPKDVECGKVNGLKTIAVCTGIYTMDHFKECKYKADCIVKDFSDCKSAIEMIRNL